MCKSRAIVLCMSSDVPAPVLVLLLTVLIKIVNNNKPK